MSAMSIIFPFLILVSAIAFLFSEGAGISIGRYLGAKKISKANNIMNNTLIVTVITSAVVGLISFIFSPHILNYFDLSTNTYYYANIYIKVFSLGLPIVMVSVVLSKIIYTEGFSYVSMWMSILQMIFNVSINYIMLEFLGFGIIGIAVASIVSMLIQSIILIYFMNSERMVMKISFKEVKLEKTYFKEVLPLGLPTFLTMILLAFTLGIESKIISGFGSSALSVQAITGYMFSATSSVSSGIMGASLVLMSYSVGANNKKRFYEILRLSIVLVFGSTVLMNLPLIFASDEIAKIFTDSQKLIEMIRVPALIYGIGAPFIFTTNVFLYSMQPIGMENVATVIFSVQQVGLFIPLLFLLKQYGFDYAISAQPLAEVIGGIITIILLPMFVKRTRDYFNGVGKNTAIK